MDIKPCGWCKGQADLLGEDGTWWVECLNPDCPIYHISWPTPFMGNTAKEAITIWNRRRVRVERVRKAFKTK